ncbi:MAG: glycoside hydrolase family 1 protein [Sporolactobacillus sp.]|nr:glycoside hydrolase family 1 protein [Sporolactobacillus sp.]
MDQLAKNFLWGTSVSSMQTEGAVSEGGKGRSVYDDPSLCVRGKASDWEVAIDGYHRYDEDIRLMTQMHFNCYRFSISWSRVFPQGDGPINPQGVEFYDRLVNQLIASGIQPMICLYHFDMPARLAHRYNGFASRYVVDAFVRYAKAMIDHFKGRVNYWLTFNEQNIFAWDSSIGGCYLPKSEKTLYQVNHNCLVAHARIVNYLHRVSSQAKIGGMIAYQLCYPATTLPKDQLMAQRFDAFYNQFFLEMYAEGKYPLYVLNYLWKHRCMPHFEKTDADDLQNGTVDFLAFSYYSSGLISANKIPPNAAVYQYSEYGKINNPLIGTTEWNWQIDPEGFRLILAKMYHRYHLPVFPIENGIGVDEALNNNQRIDDDYRIDYHREHIKQMKRAVFADGVDCMGYLSWAAIDIVSSQGQMKKRYGFVFVNRDDEHLRDLRRIPKKSFEWVKKVVLTNGEDLR